MKNLINQLKQYNIGLAAPLHTHIAEFHILETADSDLEKVIFAPDPNTGFPNSALRLRVTKELAPELNEYISKYLQPQEGEGMSVTDVREGFDSIINRYAQYGSEVDDEAARLRKVVSDTIKRNNQSKDSK
jgi:hypothetical protein